MDGWDGAGRNSLPVCVLVVRIIQLTNKPSTPLPLREHLSPRQRPNGGLKPPRPSYSRNSSSSSTMTVRRSSPLRQEVTEQSVTADHGLPSPPASPDQTQAKGLSTQKSIDSFGKRKATALLSPPNSPPMKPASLKQSPSNSSLSSIASSNGPSKRPAAARRTSGGLWGAELPPPATPANDQGVMINGQSMNELFADKATPTFSRAALKKSGVTLPTAAPAGRPRPQSQHTPSLPVKTSRWSLSSNTGGLSSLSKTLAKKNSLPSFGDRLASLDMANQNAEFGQLQPTRRSVSQTFSVSASSSTNSLGQIEPPRPAFMRRSGSNSSLSSSASDSSFSSCHTSIPEEDEEAAASNPAPEIRCTVSEGDADGSVESTSTIAGSSAPRKKKGMGLGRRLMKALGMGKKEMRELEARRGSA